MGKAANMLEGRATIQSDLNKLDELANRNFIKLNKDKCKASCIWEGKNPYPALQLQTGQAAALQKRHWRC